MGPRHLLREAHTACTENAALLVEEHVRTDRKGLDPLDLVFQEAALVLTVLHVEVLEVTLTRLNANRTVEWMVDEEEFHHPLTRLLDDRRPGIDPVRRAIARRAQVVDPHGTGGDGLRHTVDLDETHAAVAGDREALVVTEAGYLPAGEFAGLKQRYAVFDFDFRLELVKDFFWKMNFYSSYESDPISKDASSSDYGVTSSLGYKF